MKTDSGIYWLASFPKSGNTWFRIVLVNVITNHTIDINQINSGQIASHRGWIEEALGFDSSLLTYDELDKLRPQIYTWLGQENATNVEYHKIHDAYTYIEKKPLIPKEGCLGALYFIRNPLDVAVSYAYHASQSIDNIIIEMAKENAGFCKNKFRHNLQMRQWIQSWSMHVKSWTENSHIPVCTIRYEDMCLKPFETFTQAFSFLKLNPTQETLTQALEQASIEKLQQQEEKHGFREKPTKMKRFFRKGIAGDWKNVLNETQVARIINDHREIMERFGYLNTDGTPAELT